jgi:hypothetical protein
VKQFSAETKNVFDIVFDYHKEGNMRRCHSLVRLYRIRLSIYSAGLPPHSRTAKQTVLIKNEEVGGKHLELNIYKLINPEK